MMVSPIAANKLLNLPRDARVLILNNDDFGMCHSINTATVLAINEGLATSCTLMAPCPWAVHAVYLLEQYPAIPFGVHLTAISEAPLYRWGAIAPRHEVTTLLDEDGYFYSDRRMDELLAKARLSEIEHEFRAQIEWVLATGLQPTHLDSHCHVHDRREDIFDMTVGLAKEYGLGLRVSRRQHINRVQQEGYLTITHPIVDSYNIPTQDKKATYIRMLRDLPEGISEWAIHPGYDTAELKALGPSWDVRKADLDFLLAPEARQVVAEEGIIMVDYRPLQALWQAAQGHSR